MKRDLFPNLKDIELDFRKRNITPSLTFYTLQFIFELKPLPVI
jgi:hypothetical protein